MTDNQNRLQWTLCVQIWHGPTFGHEMVASTETTGRDPSVTLLGRWKGLGCPEPVLNSARATVDALVTEHVCTRYGIAGELPLTWAGEPESL